MNRLSAVSIAALSAMLACATPALAEGKHERAEAAIAEAQAKIDASAKVGATAETPRLQAQAQASLRTAQENLASGHKEEAIAAAHHASELADTALGEAQRAHARNAQAVTENARDAAADAQAQAAAANARANAAEQAAASASADAAAARATPVVVAAPAPAPAPEVSVTTETSKTTAPARAVTHRVVRKTVRHTPAPKVAEKTTTTVTTQN